MKPIYTRLAAGLALTFAIAACVPRTAPPPPPPAEPPAPVALPPAAGPTPTYDNWMDAPATPGDWTYRPVQGGGAALFGEPRSEARFTLRCDRSQRQVHLERAGEAGGQVPVVIRTETTDRTLTGQPAAGQLPLIRASLAANDRLLDAIAFSKGRFAVETPGLPTLYLPAWPEVSRVIEDCRS